MDGLLEKHFMMSIAAPRQSGKSYFTKKILNAGLINRYDKVWIFCPSLDFNDDYDEFRQNPKFNYQSDVQPKYINRLINDCQSSKRAEMDRKRHNSKANKKLCPIRCPDILIILDDCIDSNIFNFKGCVDIIAERGRHFNVSCIICSQRISSISRSIRINSDYFIIFVPYAAQELEQYIEQFIFKRYRKEVMHILMDIFEEEYEFVLIDNTQHTLHGKMFHGNADSFIANELTLVSLPDADNQNVFK